jgi:hypothetical protein
LIEEKELRMVSEAWKGLFGDALNDYRLLLTCDSRVVPLLFETAKKASVETGASPMPSAVQFRLPDVSTLSSDEVLSFRNRYLDDHVRFTLGELITGLKSRGGDPEKFLQLVRELEEAFALKTPANRIRITLQGLPAPSGSGDQESSLAGRMAGKTIVLVEDV